MLIQTSFCFGLKTSKFPRLYSELRKSNSKIKNIQGNSVFTHADKLIAFSKKNKNVRGPAIGVELQAESYMKKGEKVKCFFVRISAGG